MQRSPFDNRSGQLHGIEIGHRRDRSGAAYLKIDRLQTGQRLLGFKFISHRPTGSLGRRPEPILQCILVHLDDHSVGIIRQRFACFVPTMDECHHLLQVAAEGHLFRHLEPPLPGCRQARVMGSEREVIPYQRIEERIQIATRSHSRTLLFERAGRSIARIGERRFADILAFAVQPFERAVRHQYLTPYLEQAGISVATELQGNTADRTGVFRHIVPHETVAARGGAYQSSMLIKQADRRTVVFQFAHVFRLTHLFAHARIEIDHLFFGIGIGKRQHRETVRYALEQVGPVAPDPVGR